MNIVRYHCISNHCFRSFFFSFEHKLIWRSSLSSAWSLFLLALRVTPAQPLLTRHKISFSAMELTINICMTSLMLIMMTKKIGWYQEGGGEWRKSGLQWLRKIVENLLLPTNKFLRKASNWNENSPSTTRFFRVLRLSGIISSPCPLSLPFLTLPEVFDITRNQNLQIRTSPLGLLLNISRTAWQNLRSKLTENGEGKILYRILHFSPLLADNHT